MNDFLKALKLEKILENKLRRKKKTPVFRVLKNDTKLNSLAINIHKKNKHNTKKSIEQLNSKTNTSINIQNLHIKNTNKDKPLNNLKSIVSSTNSGALEFNNTKNTYTKDITLKNTFKANKPNVIVKTNYEMAGKRNKNSIRPTSKNLGSHSSSSLEYMDNHGYKDLQEDNELSTIYNKKGELLNKEQLKEVKNELKDGIGGFRRTMISPKDNLDREELNKLARETMQELQEKTGKDVEYYFAIHTNTEHNHVHILSFSEKKSDIHLNKEQLVLFKEIVNEKVEELVLEKELELQNDKHLDLFLGNTKDVEQSNQIQI